MVMRERETKLLIDPNVPVPPIEQLLAGCGSWTTEAIAQTAVYFDTADLRLTRSGVSLRFRSDDGWTVKIPATAGGEEFVRDELAFGDDIDGPPSAAFEMVLPWARSEPLSEVARIETRREKTRISAEDGSVACEVDDDDVSGFVDGELRIHFREVEVETPEGGDLAVSARIIKRLRRAGAGRSPGLPKIVRVLGEPATAPPDLVPAPTLDRHSTTTDLVRASISTAVRSLIDQDALVRSGEDPEGVHRARVATRRLRSHLHTFRTLIDEDWSESLRTELQWLGTQLGFVRDADVLLDQIEARADRLWSDAQPAAHAITDRLRAARDRDQAALRDAMRSRRYVILLDELVHASRSPHLRANRCDTPAKDSVRRLNRHPWKRLRATVKALPRAPSDAELHAVRKRAKQARYAYEATAPIIGKSARHAARRLTELLDVLGDHHDASVAIGWLASTATDDLDADGAFAAGAIAETFADDQRIARGSWRRAWRRVNQSI